MTPEKLKERRKAIERLRISGFMEDEELRVQRRVSEMQDEIKRQAEYDFLIGYFKYRPGFNLEQWKVYC